MLRGGVASIGNYEINEGIAEQGIDYPEPLELQDFPGKILEQRYLYNMREAGLSWITSAAVT